MTLDFIASAGGLLNAHQAPRRKEKHVASYIYQKVKQSFEAQYYEQGSMSSFGACMSTSTVLILVE